MNRIDVLPLGRAALRHVRGRVVASELDPELQALVARAATELGTPIALVSLVLDHIQLFRAHVGLPDDLAATCATDRDASFCQFVVRDEAMFEVTDAVRDPRVPQDLVARYGVSAYLGAPIWLGGAVLGSACVLDTRPRTFTATDHARLRAIADAVSARLAALTLDERALERALHERAVRPMFAELRNLLQPVIGNFGEMRVAAAEVGALGRLLSHIVATGVVPPAAGALVRAREAAEGLAELVADTEAAALEIRDAVQALEDASLDAVAGEVADIVRSATTLAHHRAKLVAGVAWVGADTPRAVAVARPVAVTVLAAALSALATELGAQRVRSGVRGHVAVVDDEVVFALVGEGLEAAWLGELVHTLRTLVGEGRGIAVSNHGARLDISMRLAPRPPAASAEA